MTGVLRGAMMSIASWRRSPRTSLNISCNALRSTPATGIIIGRGESDSHDNKGGAAARIVTGRRAFIAGGAPIACEAADRFVPAATQLNTAIAAMTRNAQAFLIIFL